MTKATASAPQGTEQDSRCKGIDESTNPTLPLLAAVAYGEASVHDNFEEMAAIANVLVQQQQARKTTMAKLLRPGSTFAFAASDGNPRVAAFRKASAANHKEKNGMCLALAAAQNALNGGKDYSNGAFFWDGFDISSNYDKHPKVVQGITFGTAKDNVLNIEEAKITKQAAEKAGAKFDDKTNEAVTYWYNADGKPTKERGRYAYTYVSTAGFGSTIFWKYSDAFLKATGNKPNE